MRVGRQREKKNRKERERELPVMWERPGTIGTYVAFASRIIATEQQNKNHSDSLLSLSLSLSRSLYGAKRERPPRNFQSVTSRA